MEKGKGIGGHQRAYNGYSVHWDTPPELLKMLGPFDDDPSDGQTEAFFREWKGFVWINPPYGPRVGDWLQKLAAHGNGIALVFARTDTQWFLSEIWRKADAVFFLSGRLKFYRDGKQAKHNSGAPSVFVAYGNEATRRLYNLKLVGRYVFLTTCGYPKG